MHKLLPLIFLLICSPLFAAPKPSANVTQADLQKLVKTLQKQIGERHLRERRTIQAALTEMQGDLQKQVTLLEGQIKLLSQQTAQGMNAINRQLKELEPTNQIGANTAPANKSD